MNNASEYRSEDYICYKSRHCSKEGPVITSISQMSGEERRLHDLTAE